MDDLGTRWINSMKTNTRGCQSNSWSFHGDMPKEKRRKQEKRKERSKGLRLPMNWPLCLVKRFAVSSSVHNFCLLNLSRAPSKEPLEILDTALLCSSGSLNTQLRPVHCRRTLTCAPPDIAWGLQPVFKVLELSPISTWLISIEKWPFIKSSRSERIVSWRYFIPSPTDPRWSRSFSIRNWDSIHQGQDR